MRGASETAAPRHLLQARVLKRGAVLVVQPAAVVVVMVLVVVVVSVAVALASGWR